MKIDAPLKCACCQEWITPELFDRAVNALLTRLYPGGWVGEDWYCYKSACNAAAREARRQEDITYTEDLAAWFSNRGVGICAYGNPMAGGSPGEVLRMAKEEIGFAQLELSRLGGMSATHKPSESDVEDHREQIRDRLLEAALNIVHLTRQIDQAMLKSAEES